MSELALITGVSGFQGQWLLHTFLEKGFKVRAVIRRPAEKLQKYYESNENVEFVTIPDLLVTGAFDDAMKGVDYVIHCASPMPRETDDYRSDVIEPAIKATQTILEAADKTPSVKRVVITSSIAAVNTHMDDMNKPGLVVTEESEFLADRNQKDYEHPVRAYMASKAVALQYTNDYMNEKKRGFDVISLCPSFISGPSFFESDKNLYRPDGDNRVLGTVIEKCYDCLALKSPLAAVHVRDVAEAHYKALNPKIAGNQSFLITGELVAHDQVYDLAKEVRPDLALDKIADLPGFFPARYDNTKSIEVLGMDYVPFKDMLKEMLDFYFGPASL